MHILTAENLNKTYHDKVALNNLSLEIPSQSIFGLLGPNGAGKSTFIRIVNQIIEADSGLIKINGKDLSPDHVGTIGYLPEERGLYKKMKVGEQLLYLGQLKGLSKADTKQRVLNWLEKFEARDWLNKKVEDLSKGMQQKIQFIATVMHEPELIILDEPFSGFDPINANLIKDEILELRDKGSTIIFSTHRMESVEELCDRIALINKSEKILEGEKMAIKEQFKSHKFELSYKGDAISEGGNYKLLGTQTDPNGIHHSELKIDLSTSSNDLLRELLNKQIEIVSFKEEVPSINDIFIKLVTEGKKQTADTPTI